MRWLLNVTCNDISIIYVTAHRCTGGLKKKLNLQSSSKRQRHFVGFSLQAPIRATLFSYFEKPPHLFVFCNTLGIRRTFTHLKPLGSPRGDYFIFHITNVPFLYISISPTSGYGVFISQSMPELAPLTCLIVLL